MTTHIRHELLQLVAAEDLSGADKQFKIVNLNGTLAQAGSKQAVGPLFYGAVQSAHISAAYDGITKAYVGGAVSTPGFGLMVANSGYLVAATSGSVIIGRLTDAAAASGDIARIFVDQVPTIWGG